MSSKYSALVLFGSGPGVGASQPSSQNAASKRSFSYPETQIAYPRTPKSVDFANAEQVDAALEKVTAALDGERLECVVFNAARPGPSKFFEWTPEGLQSDLQSLHKEFEPKGVHCSLVIIGGSVSEDSKVTNPRNIGKETFETFSKPQGEGKLEVVLQGPDFENHVKNREK
ncbi:hypothetical protein IFR04_012420 [Cadophora malorum]|uniref:Uncharacterized protein n=1 Tax=Cadophora malorum TaxID=108018 RepID=A0A8H7T7B2_9HELO|nr:hypothetical protein IFR04_012420 [Cadophora malorum]